MSKDLRIIFIVVGTLVALALLVAVVLQLLITSP